MNATKPTQQTVAAPELDTAALDRQKALERQRRNMSRALLKRRRRKSGQ